MKRVESEMQSTLHEIFRQSIFDYVSMPRIDFLIKNLGMVAIGGNQI